MFGQQYCHFFLNKITKLDSQLGDKDKLLHKSTGEVLNLSSIQWI